MYSSRMIVLSVDPGPKHSGYAVVAVQHGPGVRIEYREGGVFDSTLTGYLRVLASAVGHAVLLAPQTPAAGAAAVTALQVGVAIETPAGYAFQPSRVPMLLSTSARAGGMGWIAELQGHRVAIATAQQVRKLLAGKANADDGVVKSVVRAQVFYAPEKAPDHVYDALAMAVVGAWVFVGQVVLPEVSDGTKKKTKPAPATGHAPRGAGRSRKVRGAV